MLDSFMAADLDGAVSVIHPKCVVHEPVNHLPYSGDWHGPKGFRDLLGRMMDVFEFTLVKYELHVSAEVLTMRGDIYVKSRKSGRSIESTLVELYRTRDDQIVDIDVFYKDTMLISLLAQGK
jgi:ketosteroid isomerase-like protein